MSSSILHRPAPAILALGILSATAAAQEGPAMLSVQFPGGTVAEYVEALRTAVKPEPANIAISEAAAAAILPPVRLEKVSVGTALGAIKYIAPGGPDEHWVIASLSREDRWEEPPAFAVTLARQLETGMPGQFMETMSGSPMRKDRVLQVFSLKELIGVTGDDQSADTVLSAVELALQMGQPADEKPADVKFHADSGLLIISATRDEVGAVDELLRRMRDDAMREQAMAESHARQQIDDELKLNVATARMQSCEARLAYTSESLNRVKQLVDSGQASTDMLRQAEMEQLSAKSDLDIVTAECQAAKGRMGQAPPTSAPRTASLMAEVAALRDQVAQLQAQLEAKIKELEAKRK